MDQEAAADNVAGDRASSNLLCEMQETLRIYVVQQRRFFQKTSEQLVLWRKVTIEASASPHTVPKQHGPHIESPRDDGCVAGLDWYGLVNWRLVTIQASKSTTPRWRECGVALPDASRRAICYELHVPTRV